MLGSSQHRVCRCATGAGFWALLTSCAVPFACKAVTCRPAACRYLTPNDANPAPALIQSKTDFDPFNYYLLDPTFQGFQPPLQHPD